MAEQRDDESLRIVAAWKRERPDLDTSPMLVFSRLTRLSRHFDLERRRAFATHDLEPWEFDVLAVLRRAGAPFAVTPSALTADLLVSSGTMTNRIDRLEGKGLVERLPAPGDKRAVLVQVTARGLQQVDAALQTLLESEATLLNVLPKNQRNTLAELLYPLLLSYEDSAD